MNFRAALALFALVALASALYVASSPLSTIDPPKPSLLGKIRSIGRGLRQSISSGLTSRAKTTHEAEEVASILKSPSPKRSSSPKFVSFAKVPVEDSVNDETESGKAGEPKEQPAAKTKADSKQQQSETPEVAAKSAKQDSAQSAPVAVVKKSAKDKKADGEDEDEDSAAASDKAEDDNEELEEEVDEEENVDDESDEDAKPKDGAEREKSASDGDSKRANKKDDRPSEDNQERSAASKTSAKSALKADK